ncbi:MAG: DUF1016 N-terminal domain-containing protein [Nitrospiraceae bacterium]|jgi:hypothetical protein|nr:DUF1016 N-terminal domain-containing protein [Nitrospiraceae bacterium]
MKQPAKKHPYSTLITDLASLIEQGRKTAVRYVNTALVATYWLIGRRIVEYEQKGKVRAEYGEAILKRISEDLIKKFGKGFGFTQMKNIRQFYLSYPQKSYTVPGQLGSTVISQTLSGQSEISNTLSAKFPLSWSHYCLLMRLDDSYQREFYEAECASGNWSVRQLDRQIQSMLHERTALSKRKMTVIKNKTVVEYALGGMNNKVFASKYRLKLPDPKVLKREIEQERQRLVEMKIVEKKGANK